ncbi:MAG: CoA transferase [Actinomycetota bacterium]
MKHVRVVALDPDLAAAYCARLFASVGAEVVIVEPTGGSRLRSEPPMLSGSDGRGTSALWEYLAAGARSAVVPDDGELDALFGWADIVVSTCNGDADAALALRERIRALDPTTVHVVTSGYGLTGPYRNWRRSPLTDWVGGGHAYLTGLPDREPLQGAGPWASYLTGTTAAIGAQAALLHAVRTGEGQLVDVSALESMASLHQWTVTMYTHTGCVKGRWGNRFAESVHPIALYACSDGWISIVAPSYPSFEALCLVIDAPELLIDPEFQANSVRFDRADEIDPYITAWTTARTCAEAVRELQAGNVPASALKTLADAVAEEQLVVRDYWEHAPYLGDDARFPVAPFRTDAGLRPTTLSFAATVGAHTAEVLAAARSTPVRPTLPHVDLSKVRVLEFGIAWAGPLTGRWLADLGADVAIVEHPAARGVVMRTDAGPDFVRGRLPAAYLRFPVFPNAVPGERWWNRGGMFNKMNRSKRSVCLDAKTGRGPEVLAGLVGASDVILNNYSPRGARSMGIDGDGARKQNPSAVTVCLSGYGATGPLASYLSYGPVLQAHAGFDEMNGYLDVGPVRLGLAFPDSVGGLHGVFATMTALWERELTGGPVHVDVWQFETLLSIAGELVLATSVTGESPKRHGNRAVGIAPQGVYRCAGDDAWVALSAVDDTQWRALVAVVAGELTGRADDDLDKRTRDADGLDEAITAWTVQRTPVVAATELQAAGIAAFPVMTNRDLVEDPHMRSRGFVVTWDQTDVGPMEFPGFPVHFETIKPRLTTCPGLGADNAAVLAERLGYGADLVSELFAEGALGDRPPGW